MSVLAIDQGTTGTTCLVVAADGAVIGRAYREIAQSYPQPGWVEHDADEIFASVVATGREAIAHARAVRPDDLPVAVGITNQRETVVIWDARGAPVAPALVWQDRRTAARCAALDADHAWIRERTGLVVDPYFSATKLEWLMAHHELGERSTRGELRAGTIDTWLVWKLTGGASHATDHTNASRTMLYDIDRRDWDDELLTLFGVPRAMLPEIRPSRAEYGVTGREHFGIALPILGVAGDQQAALYGHGAWNAGDAKNTYGTGSFLLLNSGETRPSARPGILTTIACDEHGAPVYALEAAIFIAGAAVQWLRDGLGIIASARETEALARGLASNDGVYFVPALVGLGAPDWEPRARGTIVGITRGTTAAHFARAALEAIAYATLDVLVDMRASGGIPLTTLRVDGGASSNDWLMQFQADVAGVTIERPSMVETTALGAAGLAGIAAGVWRNGAEFMAARSLVRFAPSADRESARVAHAGWRRAVDAALAWARV